MTERKQELLQTVSHEIIHIQKHIVMRGTTGPDQPSVALEIDIELCRMWNFTIYDDFGTTMTTLIGSALFGDIGKKRA